MNKYYSLVTDIGIAAIANATVLGEKVDITDFAVGDGGGSYYQPVSDMTALKGQKWRGKVTAVETDALQANLLRITAVIPSSVGGFTIREMGVFNRVGQLIAVSNTPDMQKVIIADGVSSELQAVIEIAVSNTEVVNITVDPTVIIATKKDIETHNKAANAHELRFLEKANVTALTAHTEDEQNPHGVTAAQAGARASDWVPSVSEVTGLPEVLANKSNVGHTHSATESGADPAGSAAAVDAKYKPLAVYTLTHSKSGTVHNLTGLTGLSGLISCKFKATAAFAASNTFKVDNVVYTAKLTSGKPLPPDTFVQGALVDCIVDMTGKTINFKSAGSGIDPAELPAETVAILKMYAPTNGAVLTDTFTVPFTGKYKVTVIGRGGNGGSADSVWNNSDLWSGVGGGAGGSGGWCCSILSLTKGAAYPITVDNYVSSFGSLLSAGAGASSGNTRGGVGGTASGGNLYNYAGTQGGSGSYYNFSSGSSGASPSNNTKSPFLCSATAPSRYFDGASEGSGMSAVGNKYFRAFGASGGGGSHYEALNGGGNAGGGVGIAGAVMIELYVEE